MAQSYKTREQGTGYREREQPRENARSFDSKNENKLSAASYQSASGGSATPTATANTLLRFRMTREKSRNQATAKTVPSSWVHYGKNKNQAGDPALMKELRLTAVEEDSLCILRLEVLH